MRPVVIAHRGASGYLPEHTLEAKSRAHEMGADFLEQDIVATADDELVVLHDVHLDRVTDVATRYPGRHRNDGRYYVRDFTLAELLELSVWERFDATGAAVYPTRYPTRVGNFRIHTLAEELALLAELNRAAGRNTGIYPEIKRPAWHIAEGVDIASLLRDILVNHGLADGHVPVFVQCFDAAELRRLREELDYPWQLVQLIGINSWDEAPTDYDQLITAEGLREVAEYAAAIGPWLPLLYSVEGCGESVGTGLVKLAHDAGLLVHAYTFRCDDLPAGFGSYPDLIRFAALKLGVDGLFTDFPDVTLDLLEGYNQEPAG